MPLPAINAETQRRFAIIVKAALCDEPNQRKRAHP
jgi:hypothetical protein